MKNFFSNIWFNLINGGTGGAIIIFLLASLIYYAFFSIGGDLIAPITVGGFTVGMFFIIRWLVKQK